MLSTIPDIRCGLEVELSEIWIGGEEGVSTVGVEWLVEHGIAERRVLFQKRAN